ncbi:phage tail protein [Xenorhabdus vietnamensis]|uniref:Phage tail protein n=1 Tax=Xenorhabdus vietnamensis TaxID=351656 RepID=A0A1Y2S7E3_9GAMM|nr:hypothetical protein [Xenorhabdus vietnamensis]OTA14586.1 phage tail protein [Xenorhabdus vietnamensis]
MTKIFKVPFAAQGDRVSIPNEVQPDGAVSYTQGYGYDYERDQNVDPTARDIEREKMNGIFHDITEAVGEMQTFGAAQWTVEARPYPLRALVYHNQKLWQSRIENNKEEPKASHAWVELKADLTAADVGAYNKEEANQRFQPLGNYTPAGHSYSKEESDNRFQPKGNYQPAGNYALKGESYIKSESDDKYQPKGSYLESGYSYSKNESDGKYQPRGNYAPAGSYAPQGESYTRGESDSRYQSRGNYQPAGDYQPAGNYAVRGECYTRRESDSRYLSFQNRQPKTVLFNVSLNDNDTANLSQDCRGKIMWVWCTESNQIAPAQTIIPTDNYIVSVHFGYQGSIDLTLINGGRTVKVIYTRKDTRLYRIDIWD